MQDLVDAELTAAIGAEPHERTEGRTNQRTPDSHPNARNASTSSSIPAQIRDTVEHGEVIEPPGQRWTAAVVVDPRW